MHKMLHAQWQKNSAKKILEKVLVATLVFQPFSTLALAAGVTPIVTPTTAGITLDHAANGVPIVNIAAPNASGLSHNSYSQFNVDSQGLILNNSAQPVNTQLGGYILGNAQMAAGAARLILNEVTGSQASQLNGYMEVAGQKADVIVANPYGITCRGCGFINTSHATLSAGAPVFNSDGSLNGFRIENGVMQMEGSGLNASNTEGLALYARVLQLNAAVYANDLKVVTGANTIDATTGIATALPSTTTPSSYSIDSSVLGGMYANTIRLVGTEAGVGMRLAGPVAALTGKLEILSNGDVRLARSSAATDLAITATGNVSLNDLTSADATINLQAATIALGSAVQLTGTDMQLTAGSVSTENGSAISARGNILVNAAVQNYAGSVGSEKALTLTGAHIFTSQQLAARNGFTLSADTLINSGAIDVTSGNASINLTGAFINNGASLRHGGTQLTVNATVLDNSNGLMASDGTLNLMTSGASALENKNGTLQGNTALAVSSHGLDSSSGKILGNGNIDLDITNGELSNSNGLIETTGSITLRNTSVLNNQSGTLRAGENISLYLPTFDRTLNGGMYSAFGLLALHTTGDIVFNGADFKTPGGLLLDAGAANLTVTSRIESGSDAALTANNIVIGANGFVASQGRMEAASTNFSNLGIVYAHDALVLSVENNLDNGDAATYRAAAILSEGDIRISNGNGGHFAQLNNYGGLIESLVGNIQISADQLNNINMGWSQASPLTLPSTYEYNISAESFNSFHYCCGRWGEDIITSRTETQVIRHDFGSLGHAAQIIAAGNITLQLNELLNDHSSISAGKVLDITATHINNVGTTLTDEIIKRRIDRSHTCEYDWDGDLDCWQVANGSYTNTYVGESRVLPAILEGGTTVNLHGTVVNGEQARSGNTVNSNTGVFAGLNLNPSDIPPPGNINLGILDPTLLPGFHLPGNGVFHLDSNPLHPYLIETDPALNTYNGFLGSAYLIDHLNWQPGSTQRRLGDSYYEITLIRDALLASIGSRFLDPAIADEKTQYEYLMNNAIAASEPLHLSPGIALSRDQIDALQQDIVWMEDRVISGEHVLVPVVYLAQGSSRVLKDGAVIGGGALSIEGGSFTNAGLVRAQDSVHINTTGNISNLGGTIKAGGDVALQSGGDILNESGHISGDNVTLQAAGDITQRTWSQRDDYQNGNTQSWNTRVGDTASITATGNVVQTAGGDIILQAATVKGSNVALNAGGSIVLGTVQTDQGYRYTSADWQASEEHVRYLQTQIEAAQNLSMNAGADITTMAAQINAGKSARLVAGGSISLLAVEEKDHSESHTQDSGTFSDSRRDIVDDQRRMKGTTLTVGSAPQTGLSSANSGETEPASANAPGSLTMQAGNNITLYASTVSAQGQADIAAGGDINVIAGVDTQYHSEKTEDSGAIKVSTHNEGFIQQSAASSGIRAGGDLNLNAGKNITLTAANLNAGEKLRIGGEEVEASELMTGNTGMRPQNVTVNTQALTNQTWNETQSSYKGLIKDIAKAVSMIGGYIGSGLTLGLVEMPDVDIGHHDKVRTRDVLQEGSTLTAKNLDINAQNTVALISTTVDVKEKTSVNAQNIVIDAAAETHERSEDHGSDTVKGLGLLLKKDEVRVAGVQETKTSRVDTQTLTQWKGSTVNAGELVLNAEKDIEILGSQLNVIHDASIAAGNSLTIAGREGSSEIQHKEITEVTTIAAAVRNAYVDAALAVNGVVTANNALKSAKNALDEAERKVGLGQLDASDLDYFRINVAAAAANLGQATIAAATSLASAAAVAAGTAGTGFYATGSANHDKTTTTSTSTQTLWQGSDVNIGGNARLTAGDTLKVQGSNVAVTDTLVLDAKKIELIAGSENATQKSKTTEEHESASVSVSPASVNGSINASQRDTDADSSNLHYVNTHISAGNISSKSDSLRVAGAQVLARDIDIETNTLTVASLQDESHSKSQTRGSSVGMGFGNGSGAMAITSVSGGVEKSDSTSDSFWVNDQTQILGSNSIKIRAKDTTITGAVIANAAYNDHGQLVDQGGLDFQTETLVVNDLADYNKSKTTGFNFSTSINTGAFKSGEAGQSPTGQTTIGGQYYGHDTEQTTRATLGGGAIIVGGKTLTENNATELGLSGLNRDVSKAQEITVDKDIGGLNASITLDNRLLTGNFASIGDDLFSAKDNAKIVLNGAGRDIQSTGVIAGDGVHFVVKTSVSVFADAENVNKYTANIENQLGWMPILPTVLNNGGLIFGQLPVYLKAADINQRAIVAVSTDSQYIKDNPDLGWVSIRETQGFYLLPEEKQETMANLMVSTKPVKIDSSTATYQNATNGMLNTEALALYNGLTQTHDMVNGSHDQEIKFTLNYNPTRGVVADGLESGLDKLAISTGISLFSTPVATQTGLFDNAVMLARGSNGANFSNHSQGNLLTFSGLLAVGLDSNIKFGSDDNRNFTYSMYGSPVSNTQFGEYLDKKNMQLYSSSVNAGDFVGQTLGGNYGLYIADQQGKQMQVVTVTNKAGTPIMTTAPVISLKASQDDQAGRQGQTSAISDSFRLFGDQSTHSNYSCVGTKCGAENPARTTMQNVENR
jgi:filamentous hemagglutinin